MFDLSHKLSCANAQYTLSHKCLYGFYRVYITFTALITCRNCWGRDVKCYPPLKWDPSRASECHTPNHWKPVSASQENIWCPHWITRQMYMHPLCIHCHMQNAYHNAPVLHWYLSDHIFVKATTEWSHRPITQNWLSKVSSASRHDHTWPVWHGCDYGKVFLQGDHRLITVKMLKQRKLDVVGTAIKMHLLLF